MSRKIELCEEFLEVYTKIDPGSSDWRGSTLFELAMARAELAQRYSIMVQFLVYNSSFVCYSFKMDTL